MTWKTDVDYKIFTGTGSITLTGTPTFEPANPAPGYKWDYSQLASDGILRITEDPDGILSVADNLRQAPAYDLTGRKTNRNHKGIVVIKGKKYLHK